MNRLDRALGILLVLRTGATVSAAELAQRFEVSPPTIYRDIEALGAIGVPVYAEMGRAGGFRLVEGYFLRHARFEDLPDGRAQMSFGEDDRAIVLELLRWLGPGAELIEPKAWRADLRAELAAMLAVYAD